MRPERSGPAGQADLVRLVARTRGLQPWRRLFHAVSGTAAAFLPGVLNLSLTTVLLVLSAGLAVALLLDLVRLRVPRVNLLFFRVLTPLASPREAEGPASSTWYVLALLFVWAFFPPEVAVPSILILALSDPAASLVGRRFGRHRLGKGTMEGALAFLAVAAIILGAFMGVEPGALARAGIVAVIVTGAEVLPTGVDDNLIVPLTAAASLALLGA